MLDIFLSTIDLFAVSIVSITAIFGIILIVYGLYKVISLAPEFLLMIMPLLAVIWLFMRYK